MYDQGARDEKVCEDSKWRGDRWMPSLATINLRRHQKRSGTKGQNLQKEMVGRAGAHFGEEMTGVRMYLCDAQPCENTPAAYPPLNVSSSGQHWPLVLDGSQRWTGLSGLRTRDPAP
jgi:hypothetical protein